MKVIRTYSVHLEADLARIALEGVGIAAAVVGVDVGFSGIGGIRLLVPEDRMRDAEETLKQLENPA